MKNNAIQNKPGVSQYYPIWGVTAKQKEDLFRGYTSYRQA